MWEFLRSLLRNNPGIRPRIYVGYNSRVHTNTMENFWSLLKRALNGTYVSVEPFHLFRYLDEQAYRWNERHGKDSDRFGRALRGIIGKRLTYDQLRGRTGRGPKRKHSRSA